MDDIINKCSQSVLKDEQCSACFAIAERVVNALIKHGLHISFAESCTAGLPPHVSWTCRTLRMFSMPHS